MLFVMLLIIVLGMIIGGILLLKQSAKKFNLTSAQLDKIAKRNKQLDKADNDEY